MIYVTSGRNPILRRSDAPHVGSSGFIYNMYACALHVGSSSLIHSMHGALRMQRIFASK